MEKKLSDLFNLDENKSFSEADSCLLFRDNIKNFSDINFSSKPSILNEVDFGDSFETELEKINFFYEIYEFLILKSPNMISMYDETGKPIYFNPTYANKTGLSLYDSQIYFEDNGETMNLTYSYDKLVKVRQFLNSLKEGNKGYKNVLFNMNRLGIIGQWSSFDFFGGSIRIGRDITEYIKKINPDLLEKPELIDEIESTNKEVTYYEPVTDKNKLINKKINNIESFLDGYSNDENLQILIKKLLDTLDLTKKDILSTIECNSFLDLNREVDEIIYSFNKKVLCTIGGKTLDSSSIKRLKSVFGDGLIDGGTLGKTSMLLDFIMKNSSDSIVIYNDKGEIIFCNNSFSEVTGYTQKQLKNMKEKGIMNILYSHDLSEKEEVDKKLKFLLEEKGNTYNQVPFVMLSKDGTTKTLLWTTKEIGGGRISVGTDITDLISIISKLEGKSQKDILDIFIK